jgi:Tfp pilus assembly protein FimT
MFFPQLAEEKNAISKPRAVQPAERSACTSKTQEIAAHLRSGKSENTRSNQYPTKIKKQEDQETKCHLERSEALAERSRKTPMFFPELAEEKNHL